jgi:hypothetical protein
MNNDKKAWWPTEYSKEKVYEIFVVMELFYLLIMMKGTWCTMCPNSSNWTLTTGEFHCIQIIDHKSDSKKSSVYENYLFIYFWGMGLELRAYILSHSTSPLWGFFFEIGSHKLFAQGGLLTTILLISASRVASITGVSHWSPAWKLFLTSYNTYIIR